MSDFFDTISDVIEALEALDVKDTALLVIDGETPKALSSYRGYYECLAVERTRYGNRLFPETVIPERGQPFELNMAGYGTYTPGISEITIKDDPTVSDFLVALGMAIGEDFEGYKGGQFLMHEHTSLYVAENGDAGNRRILSEFAVSVERVELKSLELPYR